MNAAPLDPLRHVSGVLGSFTCAETGQVLAADMPERYSIAELESTAARLTNLLQTVDEALPEGRSLKLAFAEHQLWVRRFELGLLCVLTAAEFDRQMLTLTSRLVIRRLLGP
ncbi:MAG TPA: hypothetical protein VMG12_33460 [Polyangiaceae bacterium]|nr:hypothetical protein [Polyangiaceae bacterium]